MELYGFELSMLSVMLNCMGSRGFEEFSGENLWLPEILVDGSMSLLP